MDLRTAARRVAEGGGWRDYLVAEPDEILLEPDETLDGVSIYYATRVIDSLFGEDSWEKMIPYDEVGKAVQAWADAHDAVTYARPRDEFDVWEAADQAKEEGRSGAVVEDLS